MTPMGDFAVARAWEHVVARSPRARVWARTGLRLWHRVQLPVQVRMWKEVGR